MEEHGASTIPAASDGATSLAAGAIVGSYAIVREAPSAPGRRQYIARVAGDDEDDPHAPSRPHELHLLLIESERGAMEAVRAMERLQLRHPRLLALREFFTQDDHDYAVIDLPGDTWPLPVPAAITPEEALAVGVMAGEVVTFLHGRGVAHGHLVPAAIAVSHGGVYLSGIEDAVPVQDDALYARDAADLATLVGVLAEGGVDNPRIMALVRGIADRGKSGAYARVEDVVADCLRALPDGLPALSDEIMRMPFAVQVGYATSVGRVRTQNQDALGVLLMDVMDDQPEATPGGVFLVADGMGGEARGEVASRIAARIIISEAARRFLSPAARFTASDAPRDSEQFGEAATMMNVDAIPALSEAFRAANARIRNLARRLDQASGTTATAMMLFAHEAIIGHVGDSRAYILRNGELLRLTHDHSLLQRMIDIGQYTPEEAEKVVPRNYLYRSLGQSDDLEVDTRVIKVAAGDTFMICSDGLWDLVPPDEIRRQLISDDAPQIIAQRLVALANDGGGYDNSTAVVLRCVPR